MSDEKDIKDLRWIRIFTPIHIPKYLIEQIKDRDWKVDDYIRYHELNCVTEKEGQQTLNPFSHLYVLVNEQNITKGFLWFTVEPLTKDICIQNYSIDKEYWGKGRAVEKLAEHIKFIKKKGNLNKVYWITNYPKHSQKYGFKQSKSVLMEYTEEQDGQNIHGGSNTRKEHQHVDPRTNPISEQCARGSGGTSGASIPAVLAAV
jgi:N-acetylglutamate synthase-like GNAT family acetyltransferase